MGKRIISTVLVCLSGWFLGSCSAPSVPVKSDNESAKVPIATSTLAPVSISTPTPTMQTIVIHSGKSSLPAARQMLGDRPPSAPLPTATSKGLDFSKGVTISNAPGKGAPQMSVTPVAGTPLSSQESRDGKIDFTTREVVISNAPRASKR